MQINTVWMSEFEKQGITASSLCNNGCLNIFTGAYILAKHLLEQKEPWKAVGFYHSRTPELSSKYQKQVLENLIRMMRNNNLEQIMERVNTNVGKQ